tara:strand:- start:1663 stop:1848 length:186 start_codon:yes stop_codon:yes gene_type:complete
MRYCVSISKKWQMLGVAQGAEQRVGLKCMDMCSVHRVPASLMTVAKESMDASFKGVQWLDV